jgi:hypothetical protein
LLSHDPETIVGIADKLGSEAYIGIFARSRHPVTKKGIFMMSEDLVRLRTIAARSSAGNDIFAPFSRWKMSKPIA